MMKKILSLLLVVLMMTGAIAYATVAFAQSNDEYSRTAAAIEETVTPAAQEAALAHLKKAAERAGIKIYNA